MTDKQLNELVYEIVDDLFTNGQGQQADRLVLMADGPPKRDLGGWGKLPLADRLRDMIEAKVSSKV